MADRSSRPHSGTRRTPTREERRIITVRVLRRWGPARIAYLLGLNPSTVHPVPSRCGIARPSYLDRATGRVVRRYEHAAPGDLIHVDIEKPGNIPDCGGHQVLGRRAGRKNRIARGCSYLHNAVDDHSRSAHGEILADQKKETASAFRTRAQDFFSRTGITVPAGPDRQRLLPPLTHLGNHVGRRGDHPQTHPPLPLTDRREGRTNASTPPSLANGPTPGPTSANGNAATRSPRGRTTATTTGDTPP